MRVPLRGGQPPPQRAGSAAWIRARTCFAAAAFAVLLFHVVSIASGKVEESGGRGWDGQGYARMTTDALTDGGATNQTRPLLPLIARVPYSFGLTVVDSYHLLNYLYAFVLYFTSALILQRSGAPRPAVTVLVANLALCIATSKMFAFYPVQIDLGGMALTTVAFYLVLTDRRWLAGAVCVLAAASREFGVAAAIFGAHRSLRQGRPVVETLLIYAPAVAAMLLIRWWVFQTVGDSSRTPFTIGNAIANVSLWLSPAFIAAFAYFGVVLFGGISALLVVRPRWVWARIREEPELGLYLLLFVGLTAVGSWDIWRYLAYTLPAALVLVARYVRGFEPATLRRLLCGITVVTLLTQRPFEAMNASLYFRDWFPLYRYFTGGLPDLAPVWPARLASVMLLVVALYLVTRTDWRAGRSAA